MKYRHLLLFSFLIISSHQASSQIMTRYYEKENVPDSILKKMNRIQSTLIHIQPPSTSEIQELLKEDSIRSYNAPTRFGKGIDVSVSFEDGIWTDVEKGRIWSSSFKSEGAKSLSFVFTSLILPPGGTLEIVNNDGSILYGPVTQKFIPRNGKFFTDVIKGDVVTIYLFEPSAYYAQSSLFISRIIYGYRDTEGCNGTGYMGASSPCNVDVACHPEYNEDSKAVARILVGGNNTYSYCSGALIRTTDNTFRPFILTAFHCVDVNHDGILSMEEKEAVSNWSFTFGQKKIYCGQDVLNSGSGYYGGILRAAWKDTDFALVEIINQYPDPVGNPDLTWLGWDRTNNTPTGGACLHHPCGDAMKISISDESFISTGYNGQGTDNLWKVNFDIGIVQTGSSGAPILNPNHRFVGQLSTGHTSGNPCNWNEGWFGKFSESWTGGGTNDTRLSNWLDPIGTNQTTINGSSPLSRMYISGPTVPEASSYYSVANLIDGYSVSWNYSGTAINSTISNGLFIINNQQKQYVKGILTANIFYHGSLVGTRTKTIHSGANFSGTYSQLGGQVIAPIGGTTYYDPIPTTPFSDNSGISVHRVLPVSITSPMFSSSTLSAQIGSLPTGWNQNGNTITYNFPRTGGPVIVPIIGRSNTGYDVFKFTIGVEPDFIDPGLPFLSSGNGMLTISLGEELDDGAGVRSTETDIDDLIWDVKIVNVMTGDIAYKGQVSGLSKTISTNGWPKGFYVVYIDFDGQSISRKISIN